MKNELSQLSSAALEGKKVLLRAGFDVPVEGGKVIDDSRIRALLPTMRFILDAGASLILLAHQGRPKGIPDPAFTQQPLVPVLKDLLGRDVSFASSCIGDEATRLATALKPGDVLLLENLRFHPGEKANDEAFAKELASLGDIYVNDAFTNCHRAHASMVALAKLLPAYMGLQLEKEVSHLSRVINDPARPLTLIVSGAKMETKIPVIEHFLQTGDNILVGGAIANTFIAARGLNVGKSKYEPVAVALAQELMAKSGQAGSAVIHTPDDAVAAMQMDESASKQNVPVDGLSGDLCIFDLGTATLDRYCDIIRTSGTIVWNGPMGLYELKTFSDGTSRIAEAVKDATAGGAVSIVGGGDTIDFHTRYGYDMSAYTFVSTGGGAMLEFISGQSLPALEVLAGGA